MKQKVLFVLLDQYADWEAAYLSAFINVLGQNQFAVKTVSLTKGSVQSIGGFTLLPDYDVNSAPTEYAGLILVGGMSWRKESAKQVIPLIQSARNNKKVLGGICDAAGFLSTIGVLNDIRHTGNDLNDLKQWAGEAYTGEELYLKQPAVRDDQVVTSNGTAALEFAKEVMFALGAAPEQKVLDWYRFYKLGCYEAPMPPM